MQRTSIEKMFKDGFGINLSDLEIGIPIDVLASKIEVLSYNEKTEEKEYKQVSKIIRKPNAIEYRVFIDSGKDPLKVSGDHLLYCKSKTLNKPAYIEVSVIAKSPASYLTLTEDKKWESVSKIEIGKEIEIYDFEVLDNHNYFSNEVLSHNTIFGNPITTTGGNALKFYASIRLEVSKGQQVKDGDEVLANKTKVKVVKNKCAPPFKVAEFQIEFGKGIDKIQEILAFAVENGIIKKAGSWYSYGENKLGQGEAGVKQLLLDNPEFAEEIEAKVFALFEEGVIEVEKEAGE